MAARTVPALSTVTRTDTLIVPRIVSRALRLTSGTTSLMGDGDASGCFRTSDSTDFASADLASTVSAAGFGSGPSLTADAVSLGAGWGIKGPPGVLLGSNDQGAFEVTHLEAVPGAEATSTAR